MKDWLEEQYGHIDKPSYDNLRAWIYEAWEQVPDHYLADLLASMPARCEAVIEADGMHTKY